MRRLHPISLTILVAFLLCCAWLPAIAGVTDTAKQFVGEMAKSDFNSAVKHFDSTMAGVMSPQALQTAWQTISSQNGGFKQQGGTKTEQVGGYDVVFVRCEFANGALDAQIAFNQSGQISGLYFVASQDASDYQQPGSTPAASAATTEKAPSGLREQDVKVGNSDWPLPGTLTFPEGDGPFPSLVLVHGSGPNDRDETLFGNKPFRDLAYGLAKRGVAVLRYDKRTMVYKVKMAGLKDVTPKEEATDDALAAAALLRKTAGIDPKRVFVLGHSLGGTLLPRIGKSDPNLAGLIVLAGAVRPLEDIIVEQARYMASLDGKVTEAEKEQIEKVSRQAAQVKSLTESSDAVPGAPAKYWLDLRGYNPPQVAAELKQPILVLQGERDYQVTMDDFRLWKQALGSKPNVTLKSYPKLNHLFVEGQGKSKPDEYRKAGHVAGVVIDDIASWIQQQTSDGVRTGN